jgi:hypothetical protein
MRVLNTIAQLGRMNDRVAQFAGSENYSLFPDYAPTGKVTIHKRATNANTNTKKTPMPSCLLKQWQRR